MGGGYTTGGGISVGDGGGDLAELVGVASSFSNGTVTTGGGTGSGGSGATDHGDFVGRSGNQLRGLAGVIFGSSGPLGSIPPGDGTGYAICAGKLNDPAGGLGGLAGYSESGLLAPAFALVNAPLTRIAGFSIALAGMVGVVQGKLAQLHGNTGNATAVGVGSGTHGGSGSNPATGEGGGAGGANGLPNGDWQGRMGGELRGLVGLSFDSSAESPGFADLLLPGLDFIGFGFSPEIVNSAGEAVPGYGLYAVLPPLIFSGRGGGYMSGVLPTLTFSGVGTASVLGGMQAYLPTLTFTGAGTVTLLGAMTGFLPGLSLEGYGAGEMRGRLPTLTFSGVGVASRVGAMYGFLPTLDFEGVGEAGVTGGVHGTLTNISQVTTGVMIAFLPTITLRSTGEATAITVEYEAYSLTLMPGENGEAVATSRYTNYPFQQIVRLGDVYYGVAADGLYALDGDDFDGTPIVAVVDFPVHDYGTPGKKRGRAVHLRGRIGADLTLTASIAEGEATAAYRYKPAVRDGAHNHRILIGRGLCAAYWGFSITNDKGEDFALEAMAPEFDALKRTIWD